MKHVILMLSLCAPIALSAMERTQEQYKNEVLAAFRENRFGQYEQRNSDVLQSDARRFGADIVAESRRLIALGGDALLQELQDNEMLLKALVTAAIRVDIAGLSRPQLMSLQSNVSRVRFNIEERPKRAAEALAKEQARAQELAEIAAVRQLIITAYNNHGDAAVLKVLKDHYQEPLGKAPSGMSEEDWQTFGIRKAPGVKINGFAHEIKDEVLQSVAAIIANPAGATLADINATLALLVALKEYNLTYHDALTAMLKLEDIKKQKQAGN